MICCLKSLRIVGQLVNLSKSQGLKIKYNNLYILYTAVCVCVCRAELDWKGKSLRQARKRSAV